MLSLSLFHIFNKLNNLPPKPQYNCDATSCFSFNDAMPAMTEQCVEEDPKNISTASTKQLKDFLSTIRIAGIDSHGCCAMDALSDSVTRNAL